MSQATDDLTHATDLELDAALQIGFKQHATAKANGDTEAAAKAHEGITAILAEQGRRLDGWLDHTLGVE